MRQLEIWWADLPPPAGRRPVLLLSRDGAYEYLNKVLAVEITTTVRDIKVEMRLGKADGLPQSCAANFDNLRTVPKHLLTERISRLEPRRLVEAKRALGYALEWEELIDAAD